HPQHRAAAAAVERLPVPSARRRESVLEQDADGVGARHRRALHRAAAAAFPDRARRRDWQRGLVVARAARRRARESPASVAGREAGSGQGGPTTCPLPATTYPPMCDISTFAIAALSSERISE